MTYFRKMPIGQSVRLGVWDAIRVVRTVFLVMFAVKLVQHYWFGTF
jgi:hypothetical protein